MAQAQASDSDTSYDPDNDSNISDSEDSLVCDDEYDSDMSLISLEGGWSRVGVGVFDEPRLGERQQYIGDGVCEEIYFF